jgi:hypothetical protein
MNKKIIGAIFTVLVSSLVIIPIHPAFALGQFLQMPIRVQHGPTICAIEPLADPKFPAVGKQLLDETEYAILDWKTKLNQGLGRHPVWNINLEEIPIGQQSGYNYTKCDITIHYLPEPEKGSNGFIATGITIPNFDTGKTNIEIYYSDIQPNWEKVEWTENNQMYYTYVDKPYYTGLVATSTQLDSTIRHEIGHSLGLAHYIVPYGELQNIINGLEDMPSIMIDTVTILGVKHYDITPIDVSEIKRIYGDGGFDNQLQAKSGYQRVHQLSMNKQAYQTDERIALNINTYTFSEKSFAEILTIDSNSHLIENFGISKPNSTVSLSNKYQKDGTYWAELLNPITGDFDFVKFSIGPQNLQTSNPLQTLTSDKSVIQIPNWVKNNAGWWANGTISDDEFIQGIQYLIQKGIMKIPSSQSSITQTNIIPKWVKTNARWWANGTISDDEFIQGIQFLTGNGIIRIK